MLLSFLIEKVAINIIVNSSDLKNVIMNNLDYEELKFDNFAKSMDANEYNTRFMLIEKTLNALYEKTRLLEDLRDFSKKYIENNILEKKEALRNKLNNAEYLINKMMNTKYLTYKVNFNTNNSNMIIKDRNGESVDNCDSYRGLVTLSSEDIFDVPFAAITREENEINYRNNIDNIKTGKPYRVFYLVDEKLTNPKLEHIVIIFDKEYTFNYVNIETCNCLATDLQVMLSDGTLKDYVTTKNAYGQNVSAKGIRFYLNTENYRPQEYQIDESRMDRFFYNIIEADIYNQINNGQQIFDIDQASGITQYHKDLAAYNAAIIKNNSIQSLAVSLFNLANYVILSADGQQLMADSFDYHTQAYSDTIYYTGYLKQQIQYGILAG